MTNSSRALRHAVRFSLAGIATAVGAPMAFAQTAPAPTPQAQAPALQEIVVTGSRIQQLPNDISISPVTSVTSLDIQQSGLVRTEDLLNNLPQVVAENSSGQSISSVGISTVSLRGLGSDRTLVLINGRRMAPGAGLGFAGSPDIGQIPSDLVERVDVLTGGASATYGADAVAGVVNFILNTHYEGVKIDANYGVNNHKNNNSETLGDLTARNDALPQSNFWGGQNKDLSVVMGSNFADGKGNATVYLGYLNTEPVVGSQIDYAGCTLNTPGSLNPGGNAGSKFACGGSSSSATGRFIELGFLNTKTGLPSATACATCAVTILPGGDDTVNPAGGFRPYNSARDSYNYGGLSYLQRQAERYTGGSFINYEINPAADVYSEFMFARNTSTAEYGPSGLFAFGTPTINCASVANGGDPLLTAQERALICNPANIAANQAVFGGTGQNITLYAARRSIESGPRIDNYASNSFREVLGVKGKFGDAWSYDAYGQLSITNMEDIEGGFLGTVNINNALNVVPTANGPACAITVAGFNPPPQPQCVPWNIFNPGGVTQAALNYLSVQSTYAVKSTEYVADANITGDLGKYGVKSPGAASGMVVNFGTEYREEKYDFDPDYIFANGEESGGNGSFSAIHGGFHVAELFTEFSLPILDDKPGAYALSATGGYRYSSYTTGFNTNTFKLGLEWAPVQDIRARASYNRAVRAPNVGDLYTPPVIGSGGTVDPCWGSSPTYSFAQCKNTGVTQAEYGHILANPAAQINTSAGGNASLVPETADTYAFGFVLSPAALPNFILSVDYYDIKIKNTITSLSSNTIIQDCANSGSAALCDLIHRGANTGSLWFNNTDFVNANELNIGNVETKGIDVSAHYHLDIGAMGRLGFGLAGSHTQTFTYQPVPAIPSDQFDCTGLMGSTCGSPTPKWRHVFTADWATPWAGLDVLLRWRYIGGSDSDRTSANINLNQGGCTTSQCAPFLAETAFIPAYNYFDLSASMPIGSTVSLRIGINNLFDKAPPIVTNGNYSDCPNATCNDNTWVGTYDTMGRYIYAHVGAKF